MSSTSAPARRPPPLLLPRPWLDRRGDVCEYRTVILTLLLLPGLWVLWRWTSGALGPEPLKAAMRETGTWALRVLLVALLVTPLRTLCDWPRVLYIRRLIGVGSACYALLHLCLYVTYQNLNLWRVAKEIVLRPYLTIGFIALVGLSVLAWTSTDRWTKRLGKRWKSLHRLVFPVAALGVLHFFIQSKADVSEPVLISGLFLWLLAWRLSPERWQQHWFMPFLLVVAAGLGAALCEFAWYASATNFPPLQVALANLDFEFGLRPAVWAAIGALGLAIVTSLVRHGPELLGRRAAG